MPTLPLLATPAPAAADAPRGVMAPGGYEWWYFEAQDPVADLRITAILFDGNPFHPRYLRRYAIYRRFPTRVPPPLPRECPCVFVRVYEKGTLATRVMGLREPGACCVSATGVMVGPDGFTRAADGSMRLMIGGAIDLMFRPKPAPAPTPFTMAGGVSVQAPHGWIVSNPSCTTSGEVTVGGRPVRFEGLGYQDHNYGAEPVSLAAKRWFWSCAWLDDQVRVAAEVVPTRGPARKLVLLGSDAPGSAVWDGRTRLRIPYPTMVDFGDALRLDEPRIIDTTPILVQLRYRAQVAGVTTTAVAHVVEPGRATWPIGGGLFQRFIGRPIGHD